MANLSGERKNRRERLQKNYGHGYRKFYALMFFVMFSLICLAFFSVTMLDDVYAAINAEVLDEQMFVPYLLCFGAVVVVVFCTVGFYFSNKYE